MFLQYTLFESFDFSEKHVTYLNIFNVFLSYVKNNFKNCHKNNEKKSANSHVWWTLIISFRETERKKRSINYNSWLPYLVV